MRVLATIAIATATLFVLSGCGEEEKKRERASIIQEARGIITSEVSAQVREQMRDQLPAAVEAKLKEMQEDYARRQAEAQQAAAAAKTPPAGAKPAPTTTKKKSH